MTYVAADLALRASVLLGATWASAAALRRVKASAAKRDAVWMSGFIALALLPLCARLLPPFPLQVLPENMIVPPVVAAGTFLTPEPRALAAAGKSAPVLQMVYFAIAALLVARTILGRLMLERRWLRATPLQDRDVHEIVRSVSASLCIHRDIAVRVDDRTIVPMTWSSFKPRVLLPVAALGWTPEQWRCVLFHEFGHVSRFDSLTRLGVQAICALYWPHPAAWLAARQLRLAQEQACDDIALRHGTSAVSYARQLLDCARALGASQTAIAMVSRTDLERRLQAIVNEGSRAGVGKGFVVWSALLTIGLMTLISVVAPLPAKPAFQNMIVPDHGVVRPGTRAVTISQARPHAPRLQVLAEVPRSRVRRTATVTRTTLRVVASADNTDAKLARYRNDVEGYQVALNRYNRKLKVYRAASEEFARDVMTYRERAAEIGPDSPLGTVPPVYPTIPTPPTPPTAPTPPVPLPIRS